MDPSRKREILEQSDFSERRRSPGFGQVLCGVKGWLSILSDPRAEQYDFRRDCLQTVICG